MEFVPRVRGDDFHGGSDSYHQSRDTCGKRRNIDLILNVTPQKETHGVASGVYCV